MVPAARVWPQALGGAADSRHESRSRNFASGVTRVSIWATAALRMKGKFGSRLGSGNPKQSHIYHLCYGPTCSAGVVGLRVWA